MGSQTYSSPRVRKYAQDTHSYFYPVQVNQFLALWLHAAERKNVYFTFQFNGYVKSYDYDANYNSITKLDLGPRLSQIDIDFGDKSGNDVFKKKMKAQLISAGWKTTSDDTASSLTFTNGANGNMITLNSSKLTITFSAETANETVD